MVPGLVGSLACGILVRNQGSHSGLLHWKVNSKSLTTGEVLKELSHQVWVGVSLAETIVEWGSWAPSEIIQDLTVGCTAVC